MKEYLVVLRIKTNRPGGLLLYWTGEKWRLRKATSYDKAEAIELVSQFRSCGLTAEYHSTQYEMSKGKKLEVI